MRRLRQLLTGVTSLALAGTVATGCTSGDSTSGGGPSSADVQSAPVITHPNRAAKYGTCPHSTIIAPSSMVLVDRRLPNLGTGLLGRIEVYDAGTSRLEVSVGVDVLDRYEDLDFHSETVTINSRSAVLSTAGAFGTDDRLVIVTWDEPGQSQPCTQHALVGTNVSAQTLLDIAAGSGQAN